MYKNSNYISCKDSRYCLEQSNEKWIGDDLRNKRIVYVNQRQRITQWINEQRPNAVNNVNIGIITCLGRRELQDRWNLFLSLLDFNRNAKIVSAVLERFIGHKTSFKYKIR